MQFFNPEAESFVPDVSEVGRVLARATHLAIAAHPDDVEILAKDGILKCFHTSGKGFMGVILTNGAGTYREGAYVTYSDEEIARERKLEQKKAAVVGEYCSSRRLMLATWLAVFEMKLSNGSSVWKKSLRSREV